MGSPTIHTPKLLVIDDEPDNLSLLVQTCDENWQFLLAHSGLEALTIINQQGEVSVIIVDLEAMGNDAEVLRQIERQYPDTMQIVKSESSAIEGLNAFRYVQKPWHEIELKDLVNQAIATHHILRSRTAELRHALRQQSLLNAIASSVDSTTPYRDSIAAIAKAIAKDYDASIVLLRLIENEELSEDYIAYCAEPTANLANLAETLTLLPQTIAISDVASHPHLDPSERQVYAEANIKSVLLAPLIVNKEQLGILSIYHCDQPHIWNEDELTLMTLAANQSAIVSSHARAYDRIQELAERELLLNTITSTIRSSLDPQKTFAAITQQLAETLNAESCALSLWKETDDHLRCVGLHLLEPMDLPYDPNDPVTSSLPQSFVDISANPIFQALISSKQPVAINDLQKNPEWNVADLPLQAPARSLLVVPMLLDGKIIGSISMRQNQQPRRWTDAEISLVQAVAIQAAIAVQQANLFQTTRQQAQKLLELDRQKTEFFQNISHEFRTPLTLTIGPLESAIEKNDGLPYEQSVIALRNCRRLLRLVNQLLDIQRLDAGKMQACFRPCNLVEFVSQTIESFRPYCDRKDIQLLSEFSEECPEIYIDIEQFDKIIYNLLSNAMKFTPRQGSITLNISIDNEQKTCILSVCDTGIGIKEDQLPFLFDRFCQAEGSVNRSYEGSGLGLALVKELVHLHGGTISVTSEYGIGTTFTITIPLGSAHLPAEQVSDTPTDWQVSHANIELADLNIDDQTLEEIAIASPEHQLEVITGNKILIIDDNHDLRNYLRRILEQAGYQVVSAHNGAKGYVQAKQHHPDLIITDLMMPQVSGLDLIALIRADTDLSGTPIILLTAKANEESRIEGTEIGADGYLSKPFNDRELVAEVRNLLALKANEHRVRQLNSYLTESVLKRFLPPSLVTKAATGQLSLDLRPEPKMITVLFADIVGFTPLANTLRSRRVAELLNQYLSTMSKVIFANGGTVDKFMGDGIMALFGAPEDCSPNEQVHRAVQSAKQMQRALSKLNEQWQSQGIPKVRFRCGIHQGTAVVGMFGSPERSDYTAIGPTVNIASRIQAAAEPDCILVSATVADYLEDEEIHKRDPLKLRGVDETVLTFFVDN
ncbi:response regulator [Pseudanabaena mucicola]|uniref:histidine kinase n=1 Tax=Pseudanabaena mucicola FACHB-723 TaxID=2692860 RepID=A0ABR7ZYS8_9CYAN|nr:response regulator [Pseudanabaena mucicola]MBD2188232.1 response regulator [Pseudanabaena mucicola FACHB-723]